ARGRREHPLERLGPDLDRLERPLRGSIAPVGKIPVAKIHLPPPPLARDAPVRRFMQRAGEEILPIDQSMRLVGNTRKILRLAATTLEARVPAPKKTLPEQHFKVGAAMARQRRPDRRQAL